METEKITQEIESSEEGVLAKIVAHAQDTVPVGKAVAYLLQPGENSLNINELETSEVVTSETVGQLVNKTINEDKSVGSVSRIKASPLAKKVARAYNIDLAQVTGTGPASRIVVADVEMAHKLEILTPDVAFTSAASEPVATSTVEVKLEADQTLVPFSGMRRAISKNMLASKHESASTYMYNTVDASKLQEMRGILLPYVEKKYGVRITVTDLMMKITGVALREHPVLNTRWSEKGVIYNSKVNMGMAMALDEGLIVLSIKDINSKSIGKIASERVALISKGKTNTFGPDDISGSTFTLSSLGMTGLEQFVSIINQPENAILAVAAIIDKPVVVNGEIVIRPIMNVNLTYDHRVIDGAEAAKFMMTLKDYIENPILAL